MNTLITGANGFVGHYLRAELSQNGHTVFTTDISTGSDFTLDLLDASALHQYISQHRYDHIVHLAGFSSVPASWANPRKALEVNVFATLNMLDAVAENSPDTRLLLIGSSDQYGPVPSSVVFIPESQTPTPKSPYAISKMTQEQLALSIATQKGLDIVLTRSFNHTGPGQQKGFVISDFTSKIAAIMQGGEPTIATGNLDVYRDFTDVRDVARAYRLLLEKGVPGEVYNVGSGHLQHIEETLQSLIRLSGRAVEIHQDPALFRPVDVYKLGCDHSKLTETTGWLPEIPFEETLRDMLKWWMTTHE